MEPVNGKVKKEKQEKDDGSTEDDDAFDDDDKCIDKGSPLDWLADIALIENDEEEMNNKKKV